VDNYQVLRDTKCPAVLIEHGFHTSREEVEKLKTSAYRDKCAEAGAHGLCEQMGATWVPEMGPQGLRTITQDSVKYAAVDDLIEMIKRV